MELNVIGTFTGENMLGEDGKVYPIPPNYASKSKLVEGDTLRLNLVDGQFLYKQIEPVARKRLVGQVIDLNHVYAEGRMYTILKASMTYFRAEMGDNAIIIVPRDELSEWAALENIISLGACNA